MIKKSRNEYWKELEIQVVGSCPIQMLGTKLRPSAGAVHIHNL